MFTTEMRLSVVLEGRYTGYQSISGLNMPSNLSLDLNNAISHEFRRLCKIVKSACQVSMGFIELSITKEGSRMEGTLNFDSLD